MPVTNQFAVVALAALSLEIGHSFARFHAHRLQVTASTSPLGTNKGECRPTAAISDTRTIRTPAAQIPLDVLASTWQRPPQALHVAGEPRLDQRFARPSMPGFWQRGQACFTGRATPRSQSG